MMSAPHIVCPHCDTANRVPADKPARAGRCGRCKQALFAGKPVALDGARLQRHLAGSDIPLLIDFWAPWCAPCRSMAPVFERAAAELEPLVRLVKVDTQADPAGAAAFAIRSIPTLVLISDRREIDRVAGAMDLQALLAWVRRRLRPN